MVEAVLRDCRVLLAEDDYFIADAMQMALEDAGAVVLGPVASVSEALALLDREREVDRAVLDVNLDGERVYPVAEVLQARGVRFVFATGYDAADVPPAYRDVPRCEKPVEARVIVRALGAGGDCAS